MELKDDVNKWIVCRICLQKPSSGLESIFYQNDDQDLTLMIFECGGVPIIKFDHYPDKICTKCLEHLKVAHKFRKTCQQSHKKLSRLIEADVSIKKQRIISVADEDSIRELEPKFDPKHAKTGIETEMVLGLSNVFDHEAEEFTAEDKKITKIATTEVAKSAGSSTADHEEENAVTMLFEFSVKQEEEFFEKEVISDVHGAFVEEADRLNPEDASGKDTGIYYKNLELKAEPHDNETMCESEKSFDYAFEEEDDKLMDKHKNETASERALRRQKKRISELNRRRNIKRSPEQYQKYLEKERLRYNKRKNEGKIKKYSELSDCEKRHRRKIQRENRIRRLQLDSAVSEDIRDDAVPSLGNSEKLCNSRQQVSGKKRAEKFRTCHRDLKKPKFENEELT